jgi:hypothetical protein
MGLLFVLVGAFFVVAISVIVMAYIFMAIAFCRALVGLSRRLLFGAGQNSAWQRIVKPSLLQKDVEAEGSDIGLWDRWIDGERIRNPS